MLSRLIAAAAVGAAVFALNLYPQTASAQMDERQTMLTGGAPIAAQPPQPAANVPRAAANARAATTRVAGTPVLDSAGTSYCFLCRLFAISAVPRSEVSFPGGHKAGTIIIHTEERRLYYVLGNGTALRYGIGVGRDGFTWKGVKTVTAKREWPSWTPPAQMLKRRPELPRHMEGGPDNPLGARALYLGDSLYRIHGTNEYDTVGTAASSGCFRLTNEDVIDLYNRVKVGATVIVR
jgi:lipoprotein-anchoring transpeptidase ErfK/SrfK